MRRLLLPVLTLTLAAAEPVLLPSKQYRPEVPKPPMGRSYTRHYALVDYARSLAEAAKDRVKLTVMNVTEEGRPQLLLAITSPKNLARLDQLQADNAKLADPRRCSPAEADRIAKENPAFVWLGYSIHGAEASGSEASLAVAYHFAASQDPDVLAQLDKVVVLLDLTQNPDGRDRYAQAVGEMVTPLSGSDPQDAPNVQRWPGGRFNHRLFDLNRDWAWQTQGESRAKGRAFLAWNPQVLADHHEMSPEASYYFPPTMQPIHAAVPKAFSGTWQTTFGKALSRAFDERGWAYFSRDVFDLFYPSYGDSWPSLHGAVGMTFEVAGQVGVAYKRLDGQVLDLPARVLRHATASLTTVAAAAEHREQLLQDFHRARRERVQMGAQAGAFVLSPGEDPGRAKEVVELLRRNGIEVLRTTQPLATGGLEPVSVGKLPASAPSGSYLVPLDQPLGALAQALLEKEAKMGPKPSYDVTAWSLPLAAHVPAWWAKVRPAVATSSLPEPEPAPALAEGAWGYLLPAGAEGRERVLAALLAEGFHASVVMEGLSLQGRELGPGAVVLPIGTNDPAQLRARLGDLAAREGVPVLPLGSASAEAGPDLGSNKVVPLAAPRIAVVVDAPAEPTSLGAVIHTLLETGLPFTELRADRLAGAHLSRYTHLILVEDGRQGRGWQRAFGEGGTARLKAWVQDGGTLVASQGGALYASRAGLVQAGFHFLDRRSEEAAQKEKDPKKEAPAPDPKELTRPWSERELKDLQESIPGAFLKVQVDGSHPLGWGLNAREAAVLDTSDPILDLSPGGENPLFFGDGDLRVSGLAPKPSVDKLHHTAYALRETLGRGTVVLFAGDPVFRASLPFTRRAFLNAVFFGACRGLGED